MQLHDPLAVATPSQRQASLEREQRLGRIKARAHVDRPKPPVDNMPTIRVWTTRNLRLYSQHMWFHNLVFETEDLLPRILAAPLSADYPSVKKIQDVVAFYYGIRPIDMLSERRTAKIVRPRQVAMYLAKILTPRSLPDIGRRFAGKDHTTVLHGVRKIEHLVETDPVVAAEIASLTSKIMKVR